MMSQGIDLLSDLCFHGKVGAAVRIMASKSGPDDAPIFHYVYRYSATNSMGDLVAYLPWKLTFKLFLQQFGIGDFDKILPNICTKIVQDYPRHIRVLQGCFQ